MCNIPYQSINQNERVISTRKHNFLKHQAHEQSYIKYGNIACGLILSLEKIFNREKKFNRQIFQKNILNYGKKVNKKLEALM